MTAIDRRVGGLAVDADGRLIIATAASEVVQYAPIAVAASGDNSLVSAVAGKKIRVISYVIVSAGTVAVKWRRATTDLSGAMDLAASTGVSAIGSLVSPVFETGVAEALQLNLSAAIGVRGHLAYIAV